MNHLLVTLRILFYTNVMLALPIMVETGIMQIDQDGRQILEILNTEIADDTSVGNMLDMIPAEVNGGDPVKFVQLSTKVVTINGDEKLFVIMFDPNNTILDQENNRAMLLTDKISELYETYYPENQISHIDFNEMALILIISNDAEFLQEAINDMQGPHQNTDVVLV